MNAVMTSPPPVVKLMTAEEFVRLHEDDGTELVKGIVEEIPMPDLNHGKVCNLAAYKLTGHVLQGELGHVMTNDSFIRIRTDPDTIRGADVAYFSYERLPKGRVPDGLQPNIPDLVIEVHSPSDRWTKVFTKVVEYLEAGVRVVVVLDPATATASVYRADELQQIFDNGDTLTIPDVLPGFSVPVKQFFV